MKTTKTIRVSALLLAFSLVLLAACANAGPEPAPTPQQQGPTTAPPEDGPEPEPTPTPDNVFVFTRANFPRMDGSTSLVPLGQAIASVLLGESREAVGDLTQFNRTTQSFRNLKDGLCDILIVSEPNAVVFDEMAEAGFEYEMEPIATDALIFVVNEGNPVDNLTTEQVIEIYTGEITNWSEVGGSDEPIVPFQRNEGAGSQVLMLGLVMKDTPIMEPPVEYVAGSMGMLMEVVKSYDNSSSAIGYSVYYYANDMQMAQGLKIISIDGVQPSPETIRSGEYPHLSPYYSVISAAEPEDSPARVLFDWLRTEEGQRLVELEGYVSVAGPAR